MTCAPKERTEIERFKQKQKINIVIYIGLTNKISCENIIKK